MSWPLDEEWLYFGGQRDRMKEGKESDDWWKLDASKFLMAALREWEEQHGRTVKRLLLMSERDFAMACEEVVGVLGEYLDDYTSALEHQVALSRNMEENAHDRDQ